jgi:hypothetical protein
MVQGFARIFLEGKTAKAPRTPILIFVIQVLCRRYAAFLFDRAPFSGGLRRRLHSVAAARLELFYQTVGKCVVCLLRLGFFGDLGGSFISV